MLLFGGCFHEGTMHCKMSGRVGDTNAPLPLKRVAAPTQPIAMVITCRKSWWTQVSAELQWNTRLPEYEKMIILKQWNLHLSQLDERHCLGHFRAVVPTPSITNSILLFLHCRLTSCCFHLPRRSAQHMGVGVLNANFCSIVAEEPRQK